MRALLNDKTHQVMDSLQPASQWQNPKDKAIFNGVVGGIDTEQA